MSSMEQVYDHQTDPDEFDKPELDPVKKRLAQWFPKTNANEFSFDLSLNCIGFIEA